MKRFAALAFCAALPVGAQTPAPADFPAGAESIAPDALTQYLASQVFHVKLADGSEWRLDYKSNGYFFINTSTGFKGSGRWRATEGRLCTDGSAIRASCNEVRQSGGVVYLKRDSGEIIVLERR